MRPRRQRSSLAGSRHPFTLDGRAFNRVGSIFGLVYSAGLLWKRLSLLHPTRAGARSGRNFDLNNWLVLDALGRLKPEVSISGLTVMSDCRLQRHLFPRPGLRCRCSGVDRRPVLGRLGFR